jgi:HTH-type transcriptional regulator/antitoxin HigA
MKVLDQELADTIKVWPVVSKVLSTFETEQQYNKAVRWLDELIDEAGENEALLIESLIDTLGTLVKDYEDRNIPEPDADPIDCLKFLMEEHNLKLSDLPEMGSQEVVSDILSGKKPLTVKQIKALSERFNVSPAVFV